MLKIEPGTVLIGPHATQYYYLGFFHSKSYDMNLHYYIDTEEHELHSADDVYLKLFSVDLSQENGIDFFYVEPRSDGYHFFFFSLTKNKGKKYTLIAGCNKFRAESMDLLLNNARNYWHSTHGVMEGLTHELVLRRVNLNVESQNILTRAEDAWKNFEKKKTNIKNETKKVSITDILEYKIVLNECEYLSSSLKYEPTLREIIEQYYFDNIFDRKKARECIDEYLGKLIKHFT